MLQGRCYIEKYKDPLMCVCVCLSVEWVITRETRQRHTQNIFKRDCREYENVGNFGGKITSFLEARLTP